MLMVLSIIFYVIYLCELIGGSILRKNYSSKS